MVLHLFDATALSQTGHHLWHGLDLMGFLWVHKLIWFQCSTWVFHKTKHIMISLAFLNNPWLVFSSQHQGKHKDWSPPVSSSLCPRAISSSSLLMHTLSPGREWLLAACSSSWVSTSRFVVLQNPYVVFGDSVWRNRQRNNVTKLHIKSDWQSSMPGMTSHTG